MNQILLTVRLGIAVTLSLCLHNHSFAIPFQNSERAPGRSEKTTVKKTILNGKVVSSDLNSFEGVKIKARYLHFKDKYPKTPLPYTGEDEQHPVVELDNDGNFHFERLPKPILMYCESADGKYVGSAQINSSDTATQIELRPTVAIQGTLVSHETQKPLANQRVIADIRYRDPDRRIQQIGSVGSVSAVTDEEGNFEIYGMVANQLYDLRLVSVGEDKTFTLINMGNCLTNKSASLELGEFNVWRNLFASELTPRERLLKATDLAKATKQNVLLIFSSSTDPAFKQFINLRQLDEQFGLALEHFRIVAVDLEGGDLEANKLAEDLGLNPERDQEAAHFCLLDSRGRLLEAIHVTSSDAESFPKKLLQNAFVDNAPKYPDAEELFNEALKTAESESKLIFLQESGPNCSPCVSLHRFLNATRESWSVDFVWLELDRRWPGTASVMQKIRSQEAGSIPWYAIVDGKGNVLATSFDKAKKNIGYPGSLKSRTHFFDLLKKHGTRMADDDFTKMENELDK